MSDEEEMASEIPDFIKKYIPGITRGLSWAKYSREKAKGTEIKFDAYNEAKRTGLQDAAQATLNKSEVSFDEKKAEMWGKAEELTEIAKEIAARINSQESKEKRDVILNLAKNVPTDDLFVIIGWSSPERHSFWYKDDKFNGAFRLWPQVQYFDRPPQEDFWKLYVTYLWNREEYLPRYVMNVLQFQNFCDSNNIKWLCFNAFYQTPE